MDNFLKKLSKIGDHAFQILTTIIAVSFLLYGGLMLWDMFRSEINAFATYDLMKYKPNPRFEEPPYLDDLVKINDDVIAWLVLYNTHIDYPVLQGKDDMEYVNRDAYGNYAMWGSLFLAHYNERDFSDNYNLIYGHHVSNGTMFGDLEKYLDKDFFNKNKTGYLVRMEQIYDVDIFAVLETDSYDMNIYEVKKKSNDEFLKYIKENALYYRNPKNPEHILAFSTCKNESTDGRTIVICTFTERTKPLPDKKDDTKQRKAIGHPMAGAYWAFINLLCLVMTIYVTFPIHLIRKKRWTLKKLLIEVSISLISLILFLLTENMHKQIQIVDIWTLPMIFLLALCWAVESGFLNKLFHNKEN